MPHEIYNLAAQSFVPTSFDLPILTSDINALGTLRILDSILTIDKNKLNKIFHNEIPIFNVGSSESVSIKKLANMIKRITKFKGKVIFDKSYPDGTLMTTYIKK